MKNIFLNLVVLFVTSFGLAHGSGEARITIEPEASGHYQAGQFEYAFQIFDAVANRSLTDSDIIESHTKKIHFIAYDAALKEFTHVHPEFDGKMWKVILNLPVDGNYFLWAQGTLLDQTEFSAMTNAMIMGGKSENNIVALGDVRTGVDKQTKIVLSNTKIKAGQMAMIDFVISRTDGKAPVLTPYLGAFAHVIATPMDGDQLTHVHPMAGSKPNTGMLHTTFPDAGDYRIWIQFIDGGELKVIPLSVTVSK